MLFIILSLLHQLLLLFVDEGEKGLCKTQWQVQGALAASSVWVCGAPHRRPPLNRAPEREYRRQSQHLGVTATSGGEGIEALSKNKSDHI